MTSAIGYLAGDTPAWFTIQSNDGRSILGEARVAKTPWADGGLVLRIHGETAPRVGEAVPGTALPARCPERHIQDDQTFCTGLRYIHVQSGDDAKVWWEQLRQFLLCQNVAHRTGRWPVKQALDHGGAGAHHEKALALAAEAGIEDEYDAARLGDPSWLTDPRLRLFDKKGRSINGRAVCPRGCRRPARGRSVPVLRTDCEHHEKVACHRRGILIQLAFEEQQRRHALAKYWQAVFSSGDQCCRTMAGCPLGAHQDRLQAQEGRS